MEYNYWARNETVCLKTYTFLQRTNYLPSGQFMYVCVRARVHRNKQTNKQKTVYLIQQLAYLMMHNRCNIC